MVTLNLLLTSAGRRVELLQAFRAAYAALGINGNIVATDVDPLAPALQVADAVYLVPRTSDAGFIPTLLTICRAENVHLVLPLTDPDIPVLARNHPAFRDLGATALTVPPGAADIAADKWLTASLFKQVGVAAPRSFLPDEIRQTDVEFPLFIKPRNGSASANAYVVRNADELSFFVRYVPEPILQEYLPGPEVTTDVLCDEKGDILALTSRQRIAVRAGEVAKGVTVFDDSIAEACKRIAKRLPAVGPVTIQCMMKDGRPYFTEINARLGGGIPLAMAAGVDFPAAILSRAAGVHYPLPALGAYARGLFMTRFDDSIFLTSEQRAAVSRRRI